MNGDVVVTGIDAICSLGEGRRRILDAMLRNEIAIDDAPGIEGSFAVEGDGDRVPVVRGAQAVEAEPSVGIGPDRGERLLARVVASALSEAGWSPGRLRSARRDGLRVETVFGTTLGSMRRLGAALREDRIEDYARSTTATIGIDALRGTGLPVGGSTVSAACASGISAVSLAATALLLDEVDLAVAVAYDPISEFAFAGFHCLRLVAAGPLRPFTRDREGMRVGEGYGVFVLERAADVRRRGGRPLLRILGWGASSDAHHLTQPIPTGEGAADAIEQSLAGVADPRSQVDLIAAHATSTPANDAAEYAALARIWGDGLAQVPVVAMKSRIGHTLGAAGAVELAVMTAAMEAGRVPATANAEVDRECFPDLDLAIEPKALRIDRGVVVSLGFGGADASILVESPGAPTPLRIEAPPLVSEPVVISGVGVLSPDFATDPQRPGEHLLSSDALEGLDDPRATRRLSRFACLVRASGGMAVRVAGLDDEEIASAAAFVGTRLGATDYTLNFYDEVIRDGLGAGNPLHFAESVPNIGSAQLSLGLGIRGATMSTSGTALAGVEALQLAVRHLRSGQAERALVVAAEETDPRVRAILRRLRVIEDEATAEGAVAFVLETESAASRRGAEILSRLGPVDVVWPETDGERAAVRGVRSLGVDDRVDRTFGPNHLGRCGRRLRLALRDRSASNSISRVDCGAVGAMYALAERIGGDRRGAVHWIDDAGGSARVEIEPVSSPT